MTVCFNESLVAHPEIIEHFRQIAIAGVASENQYTLRFGLFPAEPQCSRQQGSGGRPGQYPFLDQQFAGGQETFPVTDRISFTNPGEITDCGQEIFTNTFHHPGGALGRQRPFIDVVSEYGPFRIGQDQFQFRSHAGKISRQTGHRSTRTHAENDRIQLTIHLAPDFRPGSFFMRCRIGWIAKLVNEIGILHFICKLFSQILVILRVPLGHVRPREYDFGPHRF